MQTSSIRGRRLKAVAQALLLAGFGTLAAGAWAQAGYERGAAALAAADAGRPLARLDGRSHGQAITEALAARGRSADALAGLRETQRKTSLRGVTHVRMEATAGGLPVYGAYAKAAFNARGEMVHLIDHLGDHAARGGPAVAAARVSADAALRTAMATLHPGTPLALRSQGVQGLTETFDGGRFFHQAPRVSAVAVPLADGTLSQGWLVETWSRRGNQLHHTLVGGDGRVLHVESRTASDSYNVFPVDPGKGPQQIVNGPGAGNAESPSGWLGTGAQTTQAISGNNVSAYLDVISDNVSDGGGTAVATGNFTTAANLTQSPATAANRAVAVQNLFYLNNVAHDILYRHGFTEAAGNFQVNNFGRGGSGNDAVLAEAQDGGGVDNANFATPTDGQRPRMQMYLWTGAGATHEVLVSPGGANYGAMGAAFGPALSTTGLTGAVAAATPADGCSKIGAAVSGKVALINRGTCDFTVKVLNAQNAGATAVIVANNTGGTAIFTMGGSSTRIRIPSVMISQNDGAALRGTAGATATLRSKAVQPLQKDGDLDSDIVFHEYGHGLTWRMIGGMSGPLAGAIGEGMSDVLAMLINGDDIVGEYSSSSANGIRRFRYAGYPLTYRAITGAEVHDDGEIYAAIGWRLIELFGAGGRERLFTHIVDGMNYTPSTPTYENMRDGILQAVANSATPGDRCTVWSAFAQYGVGVGSLGTVSRRGVVSITESFAKPADCP
jgi:hypothetical protein